MELRVNRKIVSGLAEAECPGPAAVFTREKWSKLAASIPLPVKVILVPESGAPAAGLRLSEEAVSSRTVLALGDGEVGELARFAAWKAEARLVMAPVIIAGESWVRPEVYELAGGAKKVVGRKSPDLILVDPELIWSGDEAESRSGVGDLLSLVTAIQDWRKAIENGEAGPALDENIAEQSMELVQDLLDWNDEIAELTEGGLRKIFELLIKREELAEKAGARRAVSGSAQIFADAVPLITNRNFPRGPLVCLGTILMSELQGQSSRPLRQFLHWIQAPWKPDQLVLSDPELAKILAALPGFARENGYPKTALDTAEMTEDKIKALLAALREPLIKSSLEERKD